MLQNNYKFTQSSVSLEVTGLPDYSKDDEDKSISIISKWKLSIVNHPEIEGDAEHLKSIISSFYNYSISLLLGQEKAIENKLIDIKNNDNGLHKILLKSTKTEVEPLIIVIGNAELSDIVNCIDQLKDSRNIKLDFKDLMPEINFRKIKFNKKNIVINSLIPPLFAMLSILILSLISINFYERNDNFQDKVSFNNKSINWHK